MTDVLLPEETGHLQKAFTEESLVNAPVFEDCITRPENMAKSLKVYMKTMLKVNMNIRKKMKA